MKSKILENLNIGNIDTLLDDIKQYELEYPYDFDIYSIKASYYFMVGDLYNAEKTLLRGYDINIFNFDILYNLALVYEYKKDTINAIIFYNKAKIMAMNYLMDFNEIEDKDSRETYKKHISLITKKIDELSNRLDKEIKVAESSENLAFLLELRKKLANYSKEHNINFELDAMEPWCWKGQIYFGEHLRYDLSYFVGYYSRIGIVFENTKAYRRVEILKILKDRLNDDINNDDNILKISEKVLLPILLKDENNLMIEKNGKTYEIFQQPNVFYYYKFDEDIKIKNNKYLIAQPIKLHSDDNKKKLIISIFIDGLCWNTVKQEGFKNLMPKTEKFFSDGIICNNFHSNAEWTYPSMASYFTGQYLINHNMYTSLAVKFLPKDTLTLAEIFKNSKFVNTKIDGDWRTSPDMGYIRGFDRVVDAIYGERMGVQEVITEAIDNIELFKDTNQYLFLGIADLHDIADNYRLSVCTQKEIDFENMQGSKIDSTSVMISSDDNKKARYLKQISYLDMYLGILFNHIKENFNDDEIIVTIFSDHGQGYLNDEKDNFFLNDNRTNVPLLIKGVTKEKHICDEYISAVDYISIMDKISDLNADLNNKDSNLPEFFGGKKRDFVISESLHSNRPYRVSFKNEKEYFYFETQGLATTDGRVKIGDYKTYLYDSELNVINDDDKIKYYTDIALERIKDRIIY